MESKFVEKEIPANGLVVGEKDFDTQPRNVLLTGNNEHRLTPIYKLNFNQRTNKYFFGTNQFYRENDFYDEEGIVQWNNHHLPGYEIVSGYNMVNVSHYNIKTESQNTFFDEPVLIRNLYYPTFKKDSLNGNPVLRNYYFVSVFDQDTNNDGFITPKDLRRFYSFDIEGKNMETLIPKNYSVMSSEFDPGNDRMYVFAKLDQNQNGELDINEPTNIFWISLENPKMKGIQYNSE